LRNSDILQLSAYRDKNVISERLGKTVSATILPHSVVAAVAEPSTRFLAFLPRLAILPPELISLTQCKTVAELEIGLIGNHRTLIPLQADTSHIWNV
jgi:hypothetical protein